MKRKPVRLALRPITMMIAKRQRRTKRGLRRDYLASVAFAQICKEMKP